MCDKEYMPEGGSIQDYPHTEEPDKSEDDQSSVKPMSTGRRYRCKPWTVSDEDFEKLKALHEEKKALDNSIDLEKNPDRVQNTRMNNTIGHNIRVAGVVIHIVYVLAGFIFMTDSEGIGFIFGISMIATGVLTALLYYGFSEIIRLLQEQVNQNKE